MTIPDLEPPILIEDQAGFEDLLEALAGEREVAVDTEADSFYSYKNKVCLIQVTVKGQDYLLDPLADLDISGLGKIFADPEVVKIFHDSEYDVLILRRDFGFRFRNLFDTRVAAAVLGSAAPGLASVLEEHFGVRLDKSMQRSDWAKRPLSAKQIAYARLDTHYLQALAAEQRSQLDERKRRHILETECLRLEELEPSDPKFSPDEFVRIKGVRDLSPLSRQVLRELVVLREKYARETDEPPFRIISNPTLLEIARRMPHNPRRLTEIKGFTPRMARTMGNPVLDAVEAAEEKGPLERLPVLPKRDGTEILDEITLDLYDRLKTWRKGESDRLGIESAYLANRLLLVRLADERPATMEALEAMVGIADWQLDDYGNDWLDIIEDFESDVKAGKVPKKKAWRRGRR